MAKTPPTITLPQAYNGEPITARGSLMQGGEARLMFLRQGDDYIGLTKPEFLAIGKAMGWL